MLKHATYLTNKKLLLTLATVAGSVFLISIGVLIENKILDKAERNAQMYQTAIQTVGADQFNYSIDTKQGRVLTEITVNSVDKVKFDEMNREFVKVEKIKERYTRHERTVCVTKYRSVTRTKTVYNSKGVASTQTYTEQQPYEECHQETYHTWDKIDEWQKSANEVEVYGRNYPIDKFVLGTYPIDAKDIIDGQTGQYVREEVDTFIDLSWGDDAGDIRYSYSVLELPRSGTVFVSVTDGLQAVFGGSIVLQSKKPAELVTEAQKAAETQSGVFRWTWGIIVIIGTATCLYFIWFYEEY